MSLTGTAAQTLSANAWNAAQPASAGAWDAAPSAPASAVVPLVLLALALLVASGASGRGRLRELERPPTTDGRPAPAVRPWSLAVGAVAIGALAWTVAGAVAGITSGVLSGLAGAVLLRRASRVGVAGTSGGELAGCWELLAVCLEAGLPVALAVSGAAEPLAGPVGERLRRIAGLLSLGADPVNAWASAASLPALAGFARAAGRSASTGAALAQVARAEGSRLRAELLDSAQARAQRAAVLITGPLGLCFLPAFFVLGIAPVVVGVASEALGRW